MHGVRGWNIFRDFSSHDVPGVRGRVVLVGGGERVRRVRGRDVLRGRGVKRVSAMHSRQVFGRECRDVRELRAGHVLSTGWRGCVSELCGRLVLAWGRQSMLPVPGRIHV